MTIRFYSTSQAYGEFSNFAHFPFVLDCRTWPTSEHYFQAQKFQDRAYQERIRLVDSPMIAARLGRSRSVPIRPDWEAVKDEVMRAALRAKFGAHAELASLLIGTGDEDLVEATTKDHYWGCGTSGTGRNMLGVLLMELRDMLNARLKRPGD
jgi:ribA/ribD-fused uncharacterized protein